MIKLDVKVDKEMAIATLDALGVETKYIGRNMLRALASLGRKTVQKNMGNYLRVRTADIKRHVYGFVRSRTHAAVSTSRGWKAETLERGGVLVPRKRKYLTFRTDSGGWVKVKQVTIPALHWFAKSIAGFEDSVAYGAVVEKEIDKAIKRSER